MNASSWRELLEALIKATATGRAVWRPGGSRHSYVVSTSMGSVILKIPAPEMMTLTPDAVIIELLDDDGNVLDQLNPIQGSLSGGGSVDHVEAFSLKPLIADLVQALMTRQGRAQDVAEGIARELAGR